MTIRANIKTALLAMTAVLALQALPCRSALAKEAGAQQGQPVYSQQAQTAILDIAFRQGDRRIDKNYMNNNRNLSEFNSMMQNFVRNSDVEVESVDIIGGASIEGSPELNRDLSDNRAERMVEILRQYATVPQGKVHVNSRGVNWQDVLDMVRNDYRVPDRDAVIDILLNTPEPGRKSALESLGGGRAYKYMYERIFPYVRTGRMAVTFRLVPKAPQGPAQTVHDTVYVVRTDTVIHIHRDDPNYARNINQNIMNVNTDGYGRRSGRPSRSYGKPLRRIDRVDSLLRTPILAFRSNLLAPLMNVGVEVPLGNRVSVGADWYYPWVWRNQRHENCFELLGGTGEVRYWFGTRHQNDPYNTKYRLLGHSLAILGGGGYWDFQRNWAGKQGEFGMVGLDYLFAMPVGKRCGIHFEFEVALGAIFSQDRPYDVFQEGGLLIHRDGIYEKSNWFGPIKAGVNLVVPIFRKEQIILDEYGNEIGRETIGTGTAAGIDRQAERNAKAAAKQAAATQQQQPTQQSAPVTKPANSSAAAPAPAPQPSANTNVNTNRTATQSVTTTTSTTASVSGTRMNVTTANVHTNTLSEDTASGIYENGRKSSNAGSTNGSYSTPDAKSYRTAPASSQQTRRESAREIAERNAAAKQAIAQQKAARKSGSKSAAKSSAVPAQQPQTAPSDGLTPEERLAAERMAAAERLAKSQIEAQRQQTAQTSGSKDNTKAAVVNG